MTEPNAIQGVQQFNGLSQTQVHDALRSCLAVPRWIHEMTAARPFVSAAAALAAADRCAAAMAPAEVQDALARHPRIGDKAGAGHDEAFSAREQSSMATAGDELTEAIRLGNIAYDHRFGQVFLIRAAGRTPAEILAELTRRLTNDDAAETAEVIVQLTQIAHLRLAAILGASR